MPRIYGTTTTTTMYFYLPGGGLNAAQSQKFQGLTRPGARYSLLGMARSVVPASYRVDYGLRGDELRLILSGPPMNLFLRNSVLNGGNRLAAALRAQGIPVSNASLQRRYQARRPAALRRSYGFRGFGAAEEVVEETVTETVGTAPSNGLKMAIAVGAVGFIGLGLLYGMSRASTSGASRYSWGGV